MNFPLLPLEQVTEALTEDERQEHAEYAKRLRQMPTFDVVSEMVWLQGNLETYGEECLRDPPDETIDFWGEMVKAARWQRDGCLSEIDRRHRRKLVPLPGAVGLAPEIIQRLKAYVDLTAVVEAAGVELKKRGRQWWGLCPFHAEKTPSFAVDPDKGLFFCHGCHTGGDVITFLEKTNHEGFIDTVRRLAALADYPLPWLAPW